MENDPNLSPPSTQTTPASPISDPTAQWFESLPETDTPKAPIKSHTKIFLIIGGVVVVLFLGAVLLLLSQGKTCLTTDNLRELSGNSAIENTSSTSNSSLAYYVYFQPSTSSYDSTAEETAPAIIKRIADFYAKYPKAALELTINSTYLTSDQQSLAVQRTATIKSSLVEAGVPESKIVVDDPSQIDQEDDSQTPINTTLVISSASTCK